MDIHPDHRRLLEEIDYNVEFLLHLPGKILAKQYNGVVMLLVNKALLLMEPEQAAIVFADTFGLGYRQDVAGDMHFRQRRKP